MCAGLKLKIFGTQNSSYGFELLFFLFFCHKPNPLPFLSIKVNTIDFNLKLSSLYGLKQI